jgi:class 3 adenylate cyclase
MVRDSLRQYVPLLGQELLATVSQGDASPRVRTMGAALLAVDISGYTFLTQRAADEGLAAVERLNLALSEFFSRLIDLVLDARGDVVAFAGDAIFAIFPVECGGLPGASRRAAQCAIDANLISLELEEGWAAPDGAGCRITVAAGDTWVAMLASDSGRRLFLAAGSTYEHVAAVHGRQRPGTIAVDASVVRTLGAEATIERRGEINLLVALLPAGGHADRGRQPAPTVSDDLLSSCLPAAIAARLESGHGGWLAEVRHVHALFFSPHVSDDALRDAGALAKLSNLAQQELAKVEGELLQVRADENGFVLIAVFGIPGCTYGDDLMRTLSAARTIRSAWRSVGVDMAAGLACGQALCALYGNARRRDYVIMGRAMNIAARLMQQRGGVLAETEMARKAGPGFSWTARPALRLKGFPGEFGVSAMGDKAPANGAPLPQAVARPPTRLVGRQHERRRIDELLAVAPSRNQEPLRVLMIEGEAGIGKTMLAHHAFDRARDQGLVALVAGGQRIESRTPYFAWRSLLLQLLAAGHSATTEANLVGAAERLLSPEAELQPFLSLLGDIVPLGLPDDAVAAQMDPSARATMLSRLVVRLLRTAGPATIVILMEDAHWLDSASWSVLVQAMQQVDAIRLFMTYRPGLDDWPEEARQFVDRHRAGAISLFGLSTDETAEVVRGRATGGRATPEAVQDICRRSGGNPFFAEELALSLDETSASSQVDVAQGLPVTVSGTVLSRVDRLSPRLQQLLKVASVLGAVAPLDAVLSLGSEAGGVPLEASEFNEIEHRLVADRDVEEGNPVLRFRHAITQEAIYSVLTPSQRVELHRRAALWYEHRHAEHLSPVLPLLAHHFRAANEPGKAMLYLVRAGEQALQAHANVEAREFLQGALSLEDSSEAGILERVRRRRLLAEALLKLSKLKECRRLLLDALAVGDRPAPKSTLRLCLQIAAALPRHLSPARDPRSDRESRRQEGATLAAQLHQLRAEVAYFEHDMLALLHSTFEGLKAARFSGPSREQAITHGTAAIVLGLLRLSRLSREHLEAAVRVAVDIGHEPTYAYVHHLASVCSSAIGDWHESERTIEVAAEGYRRTGDLYRWQTTRMILAYQALHLGDLNRIDRHLAEIDQRQLFPTGPLQLRAWFRTVQLARANELAMNQRSSPAEKPAQSLVDEVLALAAQADPSQALLCHGFAAMASLLRGNQEVALEQAEAGLQILRRHRTTTYYSLFGIVSIGDTFLLLSEDDPNRWQALRPGVMRLVMVLREFRLMVPIARPAELLLRAHSDRLDSRASRALVRAEQAAQCAARLGMTGLVAKAEGLVRRWAPDMGRHGRSEGRA